jgi:hypothetical protein
MIIKALLSKIGGYKYRLRKPLGKEKTQGLFPPENKGPSSEEI